MPMSHTSLCPSCESVREAISEPFSSARTMPVVPAISGVWAYAMWNVMPVGMPPKRLASIGNSKAISPSPLAVCDAMFSCERVKRLSGDGVCTPTVELPPLMPLTTSSGAALEVTSSRSLGST